MNVASITENQPWIDFSPDIVGCRVHSTGPGSGRLRPGRLLVRIKKSPVVGIAQLVERRIVVPDVVGSNPTTHPTVFSIT